MKEIWKYIKGYENLYMISSYGNVKSLNYRRTGKQQNLSLCFDSKGRLQVGLNKDSKKKMYQVHILVATAFIPNPKNKPDVHHIDHNPTNNNVNNLMWVTKQEHANLHPENCNKGASESSKVCSKPINQYDLQGEYIRSWKSAREIERELGINHGNITQCCKGNNSYKRVGGFVWRYASI